jgi:hypothetical protein
MNIQEQLTQDTATILGLGFTGLVERFVGGKGRVYAPETHAAPLVLGTPKHCFQNAMDHAMLHDTPENPVRYVEGFAMQQDMPMLFLHAWTATGDTFTDHTLGNPHEYQYIGVEWPAREAWGEALVHCMYGLLDTGRGINVDLIVRAMPELAEGLPAGLVSATA